MVRAVAWMSRPAIAYPALAEITSHFPEADWQREITPLWGRTPFNSWLLAFRRL